MKHGFKTVATASSRRSQPHPQPQSQSQSQSPLKSRIQDDDEGYDFKLFAPRPDSAHAAVTRIRLDSPETAAAQPGLLRQHPRNHYFRDEPSPEMEAQLASVALTGQQVVARSRWWCPELKLQGTPWKVEDAHIFRKASPWLDKLVTEFVKTKRKRPGKKSRIAARKREQQAQSVLMRSALADRIKKAKKNRDKKLRQREKEKARKVAARISGQ